MHGLDGRYDVAGVDRTIRRRPNVRRRNLARSRALAGIFAGADAVVDLAGRSDHRTEWKDVWRNNLPTTLNVLEAARRAGVRGYVFASSNHVTGGYEREPPYSAIVAGDYEGLDPGSIPHMRTDWPVRSDDPTRWRRFSARLPPGTTPMPSGCLSSAYDSAPSTPRAGRVLLGTSRPC